LDLCCCFRLFFNLNIKIKQFSLINFFFFKISNFCAAHSASYSMCPFRKQKWQAYDVDHFLPCRNKLKNEWSYPSTPRIHLHDMDRDTFRLYVCLGLHCNSGFADIKSFISILTRFQGKLGKVSWFEEQKRNPYKYRVSDHQGVEILFLTPLIPTLKYWRRNSCIFPLLFIPCY